MSLQRSDNPKRVAMVAAFPFPTAQGTQALVGELCRGLHDRGHEVHLVCYGHSAFERDEPFQIHRTPKIPLYRRVRSGPDAVKPLLDLLIARTAGKVIREHRCQLVHAHNYEGALAGGAAARSQNVPMVYHAHNLMQDELPRYVERPALARAALGLGVALDLVVPRTAERVVTLHGHLARALQARGVPEPQLAVVEPGIDHGFWMRRKPNRGDEPPRFAYCGNLDAYQDLPVLLRAVSRVVAEVPTARLVLATPNDPQEARELVAKHGAADWTVITPVVDATAAREVLHRCHVGCSPRSSWSGFPVKNLNYAAAGLPVVSCAGSAFGVTNGRSGIVVPDNNAGAFAEALVTLLRDPGMARNYGAAGQQLVRERFSLPRMAREIETVWATVA